MRDSVNCFACYSKGRMFLNVKQIIKETSPAPTPSHCIIADLYKSLRKRKMFKFLKRKLKKRQRKTY